MVALNTLVLSSLLSFVVGGLLFGMLGNKPTPHPQSEAPFVTPPPPNPPTDDLKLGEEIVSALGNRVNVISWEPEWSAPGSDRSFGRAQLHWCAASGQTGQVGELVKRLSVEMDDDVSVQGDTEGQSSDSLARQYGSIVASDDCIAGYVEFALPRKGVPSSIDFQGQNEVYKWKLPV